MSRRSTRERLLDVFTTIVAIEGFSAATTASIARTAGVAEGTIYRHFGTKRELADAAYARAHAKLHDRLELKPTAGEGPRERFLRLWRAIFELQRSVPEELRYTLRYRESELWRAEQVATAPAILANLEQLRREGIREGSVKDLGLELLSALFHAPIAQMLSLELASGRAWSPEEVDAAAEAGWDAWRR